jgi:O-antigen/teichoic acid export membrane protein
MAKEFDVHAGTVWTLIWWGLKLILKFASNVLLTRLLSPEMFGIAALGNTLINGIGMLSDFGIQQNMVRSGRGDDAYYRTAWTVQLLRGLALTVLIILMAKPVAMLYQIDGLATFLLIVAASNMAMGLNNIEVMRDFRSASLRKVALLDNAGAVLGIGAMVLWAWISPTYVALAIGAVVTTSVFTVGTYLAYPRRNCRFHLEKNAMDDLVGFGKWVLLSTMLAFATTQMDRLALGKLVSLHVLGLYSLAWMWASMPSQILEQWAHRVFFPLASHHIRNESVGSPVWTVRRLYVALAALAASVIYAVSDILTSTLYTAEYQGVAPMIRQLAVVFLFYAVEQSYSHVLIAQGRPREKIAGQALSVAFFALALLPVFEWSGIEGVVGLLALTAVIRIVWIGYRLFGLRMAELQYDVLAAAAYYLLAPSLHFLVGALDNRWYQLSTALVEVLAAGAVTLLAYKYLRRVCESV